MDRLHDGRVDVAVVDQPCHTGRTCLSRSIWELGLEYVDEPMSLDTYQDKFTFTALRVSLAIYRIPYGIFAREEVIARTYSSVHH